MSHHYAAVTVLASYFVMKEYDHVSIGRLVFSGTHKPGSLGNDDADFIKTKITRVLTDGALNALVVDFSDMEFQHCIAIQDAISRLHKARIPVAIVYSEKCEKLAEPHTDMYVESLEKAMELIAGKVPLRKQ
ncbi:hypothetical protein GA0116948_10762 [Chitinophaga costaii]|uniref:Uncharacterized protein n=1 Tax=Chitinophaga costaii TaxID=1335309 RepID=A0A1C4E3H8_9BACT|nr:hypothetical protein [Chitinophaga costaii]PUZ24347.1 hypothetical protein DCM91_13030 [Chitinophaga costaii]SCC38071.1 hypothetical protein GA0116948_10762 [Chitinophaga costaii]